MIFVEYAASFHENRAVLLENTHSASWRISWILLCFQGANIVVDEVLDAFVLDYDLVNKRVDLTVDSNLVRKRKELKSKNKKKVMNLHD